MTMPKLPAELLTQLTRKARGLPHGNGNTKKTNCKHGHPLTGENVKHERGRRICRICLKVKSARQRRNRRARRAACYDCGLPYTDPGFADLVVPNDVWEKISPTGHSGGLLCPTCMIRAVCKAGIERVSAAFRSGPFCEREP